MSMSKRWSRTLATVGLVGLLAAGAAVAAQEGAPPAGGARPGASPQDREAAIKARQERVAKFRAAVAAAKIPISAAIATVEAETKAKVFRANYAFTRDSTLSIDVGVFLGDKMGAVAVDPETGKAAPARWEESAGSGEIPPAGGGN